MQAIGEARIALENPGFSAQASSAETRHVLRPVAWMAAAAVLLLALVGLAVVHFREAQPESQVVRTAILPPEKSTFITTGINGPMALSPDGKRIVFAAASEDGKTQLWIRPMDSASTQSVPGTEGGTFPFWSPDSRYLGYFAGGKLKKIDTTGGPPVTLADAPNGRGGSWSVSGTIVFTPSNNVGGMLQISASGGPATPIGPQQSVNGNGRAPWFLPDGRHFLFMFIQPPNRVQVALASLDSGETKVIADTSSNAVYSQGRLLYLRENTLMAQAFDLKTLAAAGEALPIAEHIQTVFSPGTVGIFSVSATGLLAYETGSADSGQRLTWFDRTGKALETIGEPRPFSSIALAPGGKALAASYFDVQGMAVWMYDLSRNLPARFTFDPSRSDFPVWSPDGRSVVFNSVRNGHWDLYRKSADGSGVEELLFNDDHEKYPTSVSPDSRYLLYDTLAMSSKDSGLFMLLLTPDGTGTSRKPEPIPAAGPVSHYAQFSPDGRWVAYGSLEPQRNEVYVLPFSRPGGKRQISANGGMKPRWRKDGKEIFYLTPGGRLMATEVRVTGETVEIGVTRTLFGGIPTANGYGYDISTDGQRILALASVDQKSSEPITLVQNWAAGLKK
jgi:Tol biopolymer transport system component